MKKKFIKLCHTRMIMVLLILMGIILLFSSCIPQPGSASEVASSAPDIPEPPRIAADDLQANVFIDASRSMIGFVDWEEGFESRYMGVTKLLLEELDDLAEIDDVSLRRFDLDLPLTYMELGNAEFDATGMQPAFYNYIALDSIPANVARTYTGTEVITVHSIPGWFDERLAAEKPDDTLVGAVAAGVPKDSYRVATAHFGDGDELNVVVTDLYGLHSEDARSQLDKFKNDYLQPGKAVGVLVYKSEFSGLLPGYDEGIRDRFWGMPPTGYYIGSVNSSYYWPEPPTQNSRYYNRFDIYGITAEMRAAFLNGKLSESIEAIPPIRNVTQNKNQKNLLKQKLALQMEEIIVPQRPIYVLIAGLRDDVADVLENLSRSADNYYHGNLEYDCQLFTVDRADVSMSTDDIQIRTSENLTQVNKIRFDIVRQASVAKSTIQLSIPYARNPLLDERPVSENDFLVQVGLSVVGQSVEHSLSSNISYVENSLSVEIDVSDLEKGEYDLDLRIDLKPFEKEYTIFDRWNWQMNKQDLYYLSGLDDMEWIEKAQYQKTVGLSGLVGMMKDEINKDAVPITLCDVALELNKTQ